MASGPLASLLAGPTRPLGQDSLGSQGPVFAEACEPLLGFPRLNIFITRKNGKASLPSPLPKDRSCCDLRLGSLAAGPPAAAQASPASPLPPLRSGFAGSQPRGEGPTWWLTSHLCLLRSGRSSSARRPPPRRPGGGAGPGGGRAPPHGEPPLNPPAAPPPCCVCHRLLPQPLLTARRGLGRAGTSVSLAQGRCLMPKN